MVDVPSRVFPLPGWSGPIQDHWGAGVGGSDLMVTPGTKQPIVSITNGTVVFTSTQSSAPNSGGNAIEIKGSDGLYYYYAHMQDAPNVKSGSTVKVGQQIGIVGSTGNASASAPHLHIGIGHSIQEGTGPSGGTGTGFNAVGMLRDLQARANIPALATASGQNQVGANQPAGTIQLTPPPAPIGGSSIVDRAIYLAKLLAIAGVDASKIPTMVAISLAENGSSDPNAHSSTNDYGLWQINWPTWGDALCKNFDICSLTAIRDPVNNAKAAAYVLNQQGYTAWSTFKVGAQKQFQPAVDAALDGVDLGGGIDFTPGSSTDPSADCPKWTLMDTEIAGNKVKIEIPDLGCVLLTNLQQLIGESTKTFRQFAWEKIYDWGFNVFFGLIGVLCILIGGAAIAGDNPQVLATAAMA